MSALDLTTVGGRLLSPEDGWHLGLVSSTPAWDFGFRRADPVIQASTPDLYEVAPHLEGAWDGRTPISLWEYTRQIDGYWPRGEYLPAQRQTIGSCVGRGLSGALNVLEAVMIALRGRSLRWMPISHAACYALAREFSGIKGYSDGAIGADAARAAAKWGTVYQEEAGDPSYDSDDLAREWGARWVPSRIKDLARDNLVRAITKVTSARQAADLIATGRTITIASDQGFGMTRDREGVCRAQGSWMHQMYLAAVMVTPSGRKVFGCGQSWGRNVPDGPQLPGCPDYVFGIEWDVVDRMLGQGDSMGLDYLQGWPLQQLSHFA